MLFGYDRGKNRKQLCNGKKDVVCIEMGGTGGSTKEEAQKNLGYLTNELLWENLNPGNNMEAQTVTIPYMNEYDYLIILAEDYVGANTYQSTILPNIVGMAHQFVYIGYACDYKYHRTVSVSDENEITIGDGFKAGVVDSKECVPYRVYGIKA